MVLLALFLKAVLPILMLLVALALVGAVAAAVVRSLRRDGPPGSWLYIVSPALVSPAERSFLGVLEQCVPADVRVLVKVRLGDVFAVRPGSRSATTSARNRINQKHVDFLLVRASDFAPVAGIELDDRSHEAEPRKRRDAFVDEVFRTCGLPLLHFPARSGYSPDELREAVRAVLPSSHPPPPSLRAGEESHRPASLLKDQPPPLLRRG